MGRVYCVVPKMYQPTLMYRWTESGALMTTNNEMRMQPENKTAYLNDGYIPLKIRIVEKRQEPLQKITNDDALAEGINGIQGYGDSFYFSHHLTDLVFDSPVEAYQNLWEGINKKAGTRWQDNPTVVVYCFEVVK